jgi:hypothetical protein
LFYHGGELLPDLKENELQSFPNEGIIKFKVFDMVCAVRIFKNIGKIHVEKWLQSDACELVFQYMTDMGIANVAVKQKGEEEGGEDVSERGESSERVIHSMALQCADTLLDYVGERKV